MKVSLNPQVGQSYEADLGWGSMVLTVNTVLDLEERVALPYLNTPMILVDPAHGTYVPLLIRVGDTTMGLPKFGEEEEKPDSSEKGS